MQQRTFFVLSGFILIVSGALFFAFRVPPGPSTTKMDILSPTPHSQPSPVPAPSANSGKAGITEEQDLLIPPGPPGTVRVTRIDNMHMIQWSGTGDDHVAHYEVYRRVRQGQWSKIGVIKVREDDPLNEADYQYTTSFEPNSDYAIAAVSASGRRGPLSAEIQ